MSTTLNYRPDIDGLRAVAVIGVVLYHYGVTWLPGGFTGVDVFFVISGYLITSILSREVEAGEFSIVRFYKRRVRRILPALLSVLATCIVAGWFILTPGDYADLGTSAAFAAVGLGNLFFFLNTGYFDQAAEMQPLLYTWSLGVEEQFYLVWPLLLIAGLRLVKPRPLFVVLLATAVFGGFVFSVREVGHDPKAAFYFPHLRAWELALGALLVFIPLVKSTALGRLLNLVGLGLILGSFISVNAAMPFPGINAAYACIGAALIIWPKSATVVTRLLSLAPVVGIGLVSYSLYLWHWPILVLFRHYANGRMPLVFEAVLLGSTVVGLSYLTWRFIEIPFRSRSTRFNPLFATGFAAVGVIAAAMLLFASDGVPNRISEQVNGLESIEAMVGWPCPQPLDLKGSKRQLCGFGASWEEAETKIFLWGDSHAQHLSPIFDAAMKGMSVSGVLFSECPAILGAEIGRYRPDRPGYNEECGSMRVEALDILQKNSNINVVILAAAWTTILDTLQDDPADTLSHASGLRLLGKGLLEVVDQASLPDRQFVVVGDIPLFEVDPLPCYIASKSSLVREQCPDGVPSISREEMIALNSDTYNVIARVASARENTRVLQLGYGLCRADECTQQINDEFLFRDRGHFRRNLSDSTLRELGSQLDVRRLLILLADSSTASQLH